MAGLARKKKNSCSQRHGLVILFKVLLGICLFSAATVYAVDTDGDGVPDAVESSYQQFLFMQPLANLPQRIPIYFRLDPNDPLDALEDSDFDGIPDGWEVLHGFDPLDASDALLDADGDGWSNHDEYVNQTDPHVETIFGVLDNGELPNIQAGNGVGVLPGSASVNEMGAATYSVPIELPPGVNGMTPSLSLNYNSQSGNGLLGVGWSLGGASSIHRCGQTYVRDDQVSGINYDDGDRLCMDGQPLLLVSGNYWAAGSVYRPETDRFTTVVAHGQHNHGPEHFTVYQSNGEIWTYGDTSNSRLPGRYGIFQWWLSARKDHYDNRIAYQYDVTHNNYRLDQIQYGMYFVTFHYEARPDVQKGYYVGGGIAYKQLHRFQGLSIQANDHIIYSYRLGYESDAEPIRSRLTHIQRCAQGECLPATELHWAYITPGWGNYASGFHGICSNDSTDDRLNCSASNEHSYLFTPELNGDGFADFCYRSSSGIQCFLGDGAGGYQQHIDTSLCANGSADCTTDQYFESIRFMDINSDGKDDLLYRDATHFKTYLSTGSGFTGPNAHPVPTITASCDEDEDPPCTQVDRTNNLAGAELNGDGLLDLCYRGKQGIQCLLGDGAGNWHSQISTAICGSNDQDHGICNDEDNYSTIRFADFNGDGLSDLFYRSDSGIRIFFATGNGFTTTSYASNFCGNYNGNYCNEYVYTSDLNGDGLTDFCGRPISGGLTCYLNNGLTPNSGGFVQVLVSTLCATDHGNCNQESNYHTIQFVDLNGDGLQDLFYRGNSQIQIHYLRQSATSGNDITFNFELGLVTSICSNGYNDCDGEDNYYSLKFADFNGDGQQDLYFRANSGLRMLLQSSWHPTYVSEIINTLGATTQFSYLPLTKGSVYTAQSNASFPVRNLTMPLYVVAELNQANGIGGLHRQTYHYKGLKAHQQGLGLLGFAALETTDHSNNHRSETHYSQDWSQRTQGRVSSRYQYVNGVMIGHSETDYTTIINQGVYTPLIATQTNAGYELDGSFKSISSNEYSYTLDGLLQDHTRCVSDLAHSFSAPLLCTNLSQRIFQSDLHNDYYGSGHLASYLPRPIYRTTNRQRVLQGTQTLDDSTRTQSFAYDTDTGALTKQIIEPDIPSLRLITEHSYNDQGLKIQTTRYGQDMAARSNHTNYDEQGRIIQQTNALEHVVQLRYQDPHLPWIVTEQIDPNGLSSQTSYDVWGRLIEQQHPTGAISVTQWHWCDNHCDAGEQYYQTQAQSGRSPQTQYFDLHNRVVRQTHYGYDGSNAGALVVQYTQYNAQGQIVRRSAPLYAGDPGYWTTTTFDALGRPLTIHQEGLGIVQSMDYQGHTVRQTDSLGQTTTTISNGLGQKVRVIDTQGQSLYYRYGSFGELTRTVDAQGNPTTISYNVRGHKTQVDDPDQGVWSYSYYVDGKLKTQTDAKGQTISHYYDKLNRLTQRVHDGNTGLFSHWWSYDHGFYAKGQLTSIANHQGQSEQFSFNSRGLLDSRRTTINGNLYETRYNYDSIGRLSTKQYPNHGPNVNYSYHGISGQLIGLIEQGTNTPYWRATYFNARAQLESFQLGNGINTTNYHEPGTGWLTSINSYKSSITYQNLTMQFDTSGNLTQRQDQVQNISESFSYDTLNRLTSSQTQSQIGQHNITVNYDALGNISYKSDVGNYTYAQSCNSITPGPHAVTQVSGSINNSYCYDANGNRITSSNGSINYNIFNQPTTMTEGGQQVQIGYAADRQRYIRVDSSSGSTTVTHYVGEDYQRIKLPDNTIQHKYTIGSHTQITRTEQDTSDIEVTHYFHHDHLGSVVAISDPNANLIAQYSFDPWGKRRQVTWDPIAYSDLVDSDGDGLADTLEQSYRGLKQYIRQAGRLPLMIPVYLTFDANDGTDGLQDSDNDGFSDGWEISNGSDPLDAKDNGESTVASITRRGFTGHEMLDTVNLVFMKGRTYDPIIGRFVTPDPFVQAPSDLQSYNRYSYVRNNPLTLVDPSGYFFKKAFKKLRKFVKKYWRPMLSIGIAVLNPGAMFASSMWAQGAITGAISGGIATGSAKGALVGALTGAALGGIHSKFDTLAKGAGLAGQEAISFSSNAALATKKLMSHGLVGGVSSTLNGGKFASGMMSMGFSQAANLTGAMGNLSGYLGGSELAASSLLGGIGSVAGGGDFAYGAVQGAWSHYLNDRIADRRMKAERARKFGTGELERTQPTLAGISEGSGYLATGWLAVPGGQPVSSFFGLISLVSGAINLAIDYSMGIDGSLQAGQLANDVATNRAAGAALQAVGHTPVGRGIATGTQVLNHTVDYMTNNPP